MNRLKSALGSDVAGRSLRSGGATALATAGTPDDHIQARGRWSSHAYHTYIRKHPVMLQSLLHGRSAFDIRSSGPFTIPGHQTSLSYTHFYGHALPNMSIERLGACACYLACSQQARRFDKSNK